MTESQQFRSLRRILLGLILFGAFLIRYHLIVQKGFWVDEMFDACFIHESWKTTLERAVAIWSSPLHMCLVKAAWILQSSEISMRMPDMAFSLLTIFLFYRLAARFLGNKWLGVLGALMIAVSGYHIHYTLELRPFGPAITFALLIALSFERSIAKGRSWGMLWFLLFSALGLYNMLSAAFVLAGCGVWMMVEGVRRWRAGRLSGAQVRLFALAIGAMVLLAVQILTMNLRQPIKGFGDKPPDNIWLALLGSWQFWLGGVRDRFEPYGVKWMLYVSAALFPLGLIYVRRIRAWPMVLVTLLTTVYVVIAFMRGIHYYSSRFYCAQYPFFLLVLLNGAYMAYQFAARRIEQSRWRRLFGPRQVAALALAISALLIIHSHWRGVRSLWLSGKEIPRTFREDVEFLDINAAFNETIYLSTDLNYPLYYFRIYFRHHVPQTLPKPLRNPAALTPFWVYTFEQNLFERFRELESLPHHRVQLAFFHVWGRKAYAYYFYKGQLNEVDWLCSLKPLTARADIMLRLFDHQKFDTFDRYLDDVDLVPSWELSEMVRKFPRIYLAAKEQKAPLDKLRNTLLALIRLIDERDPRGNPAWGIGDVFIPARCVWAYLDMGMPGEALEFGRRYLDHYYQNSHMLWVMAIAEARTRNPRKALDYFWETVKRGHVSATDIWLFQEINAVLKTFPDEAKDYREMIDAILRLRLDYYKKIADAGNLDVNVAEIVVGLLKDRPEMQGEYRDLYERAERYDRSKSPAKPAGAKTP